MSTTDWEIIKYFDPDNTYCACGCGQGPEEMKPRTMLMLDLARKQAGIPFVLTSAFRCPQHNEDVGGAENSAHKKGYGVDIECKDSRSRFVIIDALLRVGFTRIGIAETFIHADNDPDNTPQVAWVY